GTRPGVLTIQVTGVSSVARRERRDGAHGHALVADLVHRRVRLPVGGVPPRVVRCGRAAGGGPFRGGRRRVEYVHGAAGGRVRGDADTDGNVGRPVRPASGVDGRVVVPRTGAGAAGSGHVVSAG